MNNRHWSAVGRHNTRHTTHTHTQRTLILNLIKQVNGIKVDYFNHTFMVQPTIFIIGNNLIFALHLLPTPALNAERVQVRARSK